MGDEVSRNQWAAGSVLLCAALALFAPAWASGEPRSVSLAEVLEGARRRTPGVRGGAAGVAVAEAERSQGHGRYFPLIRTDGNILVWDQPLQVSFTTGTGAPTQLPPPQTPYEELLSKLVAGFSEPTQVQDQVTGQIAVSLVQPLTPLVTVGEGYEALDLEVDAARNREQTVVRRAELNGAISYYRLHQATAMVASAKMAMAQLDAQRAQVEALLRSGMATPNDLLKVNVARAAAQERLIRAQAAESMSQQGLAVAMGLPVGTDIAAKPLGQLTCAPPAESVAALMTRAVETRPELAELGRRIRQAEIAGDEAWVKLLPNLDLVATYRHTGGQKFAEPDSFFAGVTLNWNVFDWGATYYGIDAAAGRQEQVEAQTAAAADQLRLEVQKAWLDLRASAEAEQVTAMAEQEAEQSHGIEMKRYEGGVATTYDVLTAETALDDTRDRRIVAQYQCLIADATLRSAVGEPLARTE